MLGASLWPPGLHRLLVTMAELLPCPGVKHWCGHQHGSNHCHCHLPLLLCTSTAAVGNIHLTRGCCNSVLAYPRMVFEPSYSPGLMLRFNFDG